MDTRFAALISRLSTGKLALDVGVTPTTVSKWKGSLWLPRPQHYEKIAQACKMTVDELAAVVYSDHIERPRVRRAANLTSSSKES
jgi:transcriptional regulator with XRE-family HTH domain